MSLIDSTSHSASRWKQWAGLLARFLSGEMVIQVISFATGVFLFQHFTKSEAAYYNLANSMLGMMVLLSDNGIGAGIYAIGGKVWQDRRRFGELINTALQLRRTLTIITMVVIAPFTWWLLVHNGCSPTHAAMITLLVLIGTHYQILGSILGEVPKLHLQAVRFQKLNVWVALIRLGLLGVAWLTWLSALTALVANLLGSIFQTRVLKKWVPPLADPEAMPHGEDRRIMIGLMKRQLPSSIYFCLSGQVSLFLISITGNVSAVADVAALSALSRIFSVVAAVLSTIILPRFSHLQKAGVIWVRYLQILGLFVVMGLGMCAVAAMFPHQLLFLVGKNYYHLENEVLLMVGGSVLGVVSGSLFALNTVRGWIISPWLHIPVSISTQALLIFLLPVNTVSGVLWLGLLSHIPAFAMNFWQTQHEVRKQRKAEAINPLV